MGSHWKYACRLYYGRKAEPPKIPHELAIETRHGDAVSKDMEVAAGKSRADIGRIEVRCLQPAGHWVCVFNEDIEPRA